MRNGRSARAVCAVLILSMLLSLIPTIKLNETPASAAEVKYGYVHVSDYVYFRSGAGVSYAIVKDNKGNLITLYGNQKVRILKSQTGTDGNLWYNISVDYNGETYKGWLMSEYIQDYTGTYNEKYAKKLRKAGFPESYIPALCYLHSLHPKWTFTPYFTGGGTSLETSLDWNTSVEKEMELGRNLANVGYEQKSHGMSGLSRSSWLSQGEGAYNPKTDIYTSFDSGYFAQVSEEFLSYYMDPRNFLSEKGILMFESQAYNPEIQTREGVVNMIKDSYMETDYEEGKSYADLLISAAEASGVSPYVLVGRIFTEQGRDGSGGCICGVYPGYEGLYNHFDVGAWETTDPVTGEKINAVENGLKYAAMTDESLLRPWNTIEKAITGGAIFIGREYIKRGQLNAYLLKFNVTDTYTYVHQYMGAVICPAVDAYIAYQTYEDDGTALDLQIPVYQNMPEEPCPKPMEYGCANSYLSSLSVDGVKLTPTFSYDNLNYSTTIEGATGSIVIDAKAVCSLATVKGTGEKELKEGKNVFKIVVTAENGSTTTYKLTINMTGEIPPGVTTSTYNIQKKYIVGIAPETKPADFLKNMKITGSTSTKVTDSKGKELAEDALISTGCILETSFEKYTLCVNGDVFPDGKVTVKDLLYVKKNLMGSMELKKAQVLASTVSGGSKTSVRDLLMIKQHLLGIITINVR